MKRALLVALCRARDREKWSRPLLSNPTTNGLFIPEPEDHRSSIITSPNLENVLEPKKGSA